MEVLLFSKLKLDINLCSIKRLSEDKSTSIKHINEIITKTDEDLYEMFESSGYAKQRIYLLHPDTNKSYLEIVSIMTFDGQFSRKRRYAVLGTNEDINSIVSSNEKNRPKNKNVPIRLNPGEARSLFLYLTTKGLICGIMSETFDQDD